MCLNDLTAPYIDVCRYHQLLDEIHQCYLDQREQLLNPSITSTITDLTNQNIKDHCALVRHSLFKVELPFRFCKVTSELAECTTWSLWDIFCSVWCRHKAVRMINGCNLRLCTAGILSCYVHKWSAVQTVVCILCHTSSIKAVTTVLFSSCAWKCKWPKGWHNH